MIALVILCAVVAMLSPDFRKPENLVKLVNQWSFVGLVAIGMTWVIILGGIDLSVGSMVAILGGVGLIAMGKLKGEAPSGENAAPPSQLWPMIAAGAIMVLGGPILGLLNALAITLGRLTPFIATLGAMAIYRSVVLALSDGSEIRSPIDDFGALGSPTQGITIPFVESTRGRPLVATWPILTFVAVAILSELVLRGTVLGRRIFAVGDNPTAARYAGVNISRVTIAVYAFAGLTCGLAALLYTSRLNSISSSQAGLMWELDAIAAVVIGGTSMRGGSGSVIGTVVGVLILGVIDNMLNMLDVNTHLQGLVKGCIILAAVLIQRPAGPSR